MNMQINKHAMHALGIPNEWFQMIFQIVPNDSNIIMQTPFPMPKELSLSSSSGSDAVVSAKLAKDLTPLALLGCCQAPA